MRWLPRSCRIPRRAARDYLGYSSGCEVGAKAPAIRCHPKALATDSRGGGNHLRYLSPPRPHCSGQPLRLAFSGGGHPVHFQPAYLRALAARALPYVAGQPDSRILVAYCGRAVCGGYSSPLRGGAARGTDTGHLRGLWKPRVGVSGARGLGAYICRPGGASWCSHPGVQKRRTGTQVDPARICARAHSRDVHTRVASEQATILSNR